MKESKAEKSSKPASSKDKVLSGSNAMNLALEIKRSAKHPVWHAYRSYANHENLEKEWLICDVTSPLQGWYEKQVNELKGVQEIFEWLKS